jgi:hypothetical protein
MKEEFGLEGGGPVCEPGRLPRTKMTANNPTIMSSRTISMEAEDYNEMIGKANRFGRLTVHITRRFGPHG